MSFEQKPFLILLAIVFTWWWCIRQRERSVVVLLLSASLLFYAYKHWYLLPILLAYCVVNWWVAVRIERSVRARGIMLLGVAFNLLVLCYYKYTPLVMTTFTKWLPEVLPPLPHDAFEKWSIPYGISFYAFTGIAYMVDVYRKTTTAEGSFWRYALSACFFPHLVAGLILRPYEFLDRVRPNQLPTSPDAPGEAVWLIARGFFKKLVVADRIGATIDPFFAHVNDATTAGVWALPYVWLYALQIFFDFSAYTDMARGIGMLFGYRWPENFDRPYLSLNITDFWRRWHMTLSRFLRDYLYISLGGNRHGRLRTYTNLLLTMLLGGLWHGDQWSFLVWGGLHGAFLIGHRLWCSTPIAIRFGHQTGVIRYLWHSFALLLTFHSVCLAWCFFRLTEFNESVACVRKWVLCDADKMWVGPWTDPAVWLAIAFYALLSWLADLLQHASTKYERPLLTGATWGLRFATLTLAALLAPVGVKAAFIYFQF